MTFFQVLITNEHSSSIDCQYKHVYNYATLAEAMKVYNMYDYKKQDGITFKEPTSGRELVQQKLNYTENGGAVLELRYEYLNEEQFRTQESIIVKEIIL